MTLQEGIVIGIPLIHRHDHMLLASKEVLGLRIDKGVDAGAHQRRRHDHAHGLPVIAAEICREHAVHLAPLQGLQGLLRGGVGHRLKIDTGVHQTAGPVIQEVLQGAGELPRGLVRGAEGQKVVLVSHPDRPVLRQIVRLLLAQERVGPRGHDVPFKHLLIVVPVLLLDAVHGVIQLIQQVRPVLVHREVKIGGADPAHRHRPVRVPEGVQGHISVQRSGIQHSQGFVLGARQLHELRLNAVLLLPFQEIVHLDAAFVHADPLPVEGGIIRRDLPVARSDEDTVFLRPHGKGGEQHGRGALLRKGDVAHQVDLPVGKHLHQIRPAALHILVFPAGIGGDLALILIGIAGPPSGLIRLVEGRLVPAHPHRFPLVPRLGRDRRQERRQDQEARKERRAPFDSPDRLFAWIHGTPLSHRRVMLPRLTCPARGGRIW